MLEILEPTVTNPIQKKVLVETWGCQMNIADSERMLALLHRENYAVTQSADDADLVLLNTCHIREKAKHKIMTRLGVLHGIKKNRPGMKIVVAGCVAQAEGKKLMEAAPVIDFLIGPSKINDLPALLKSNRKMSLGFKKDEFSADDVQSLETLDEIIPSVSGKNSISRYVNIVQGCNNFCTFCVVPFTRGPEVSRTPQEVVQEVKKLLRQGAKEISLLGQNVNSYGLDLIASRTLNSCDRSPFVDLLDLVSQIPELERLRFTTSNPHDFTKPLADLFKNNKKLGRHMHLPVQSGSDSILAAMKRKVTVAEYYERIDWLRTAVPDMAISTDLIVGFPGESDDDFAATLDLIEKVNYSFIFAFKYSPRKNTAAFRFRNQVDEKVMDMRLAKLNAVQDALTNRQIEQQIGQKFEVLFLYESKKTPGIFYGRNEHFRLIRAASTENLAGQTREVLITQGNKVALQGQI